VITLIVSAAIVERAGSFLVTRRQRGVHLEGYWEFPGGKCEPGESVQSCLARELKEELNVAIRADEEVFVTRHAYPDRIVELHFLKCELLGEPAPQLGQEMAWVERSALASLAFPPADLELVEWLIKSQGSRLKAES
jgi:8-oxo-dGTP diphosphatase